MKSTRRVEEMKETPGDETSPLIVASDDDLPPSHPPPDKVVVYSEEIALHDDETTHQHGVSIVLRVLRLAKIVIVFSVLLIGIIWYGIYDEVEHEYSFALTRTKPLILYLDDHLPKNYVEVGIAEPIDASAQFSPPNQLMPPTPRTNTVKEISVLFQAATDVNMTNFLTLSNATLTFKGSYNQNANATGLSNVAVFQTSQEYLGSTLRLVVSALEDHASNSSDDTPFAISMEITQHTGVYNGRVALAFCVLIFVYILIIFELVDRTVATLLGAFLSISAMALMNLRPSFHNIVEWVEFHTLCLLFGMMTIVAVLSTTGFFEWIALRAYKLSRGSIWALVVILCVFVAISSSMLDNVTAMLLLTPVIIRLSKVVNISPVPILMSTVLVSNIGGCATAVGDPPVVLIVNTPEIKKAGIGFNEILFFMAPGTVIMFLASLVLLRIQFRSFFRTEPVQMTGEMLQIKQEIVIWQQSASRLSERVPDEQVVKERLTGHIVQLEEQLKDAYNQVSGKKVDLTELEKEYVIRDVPLFALCAIILSAVILMFFLETFINQWVHFSLDSIALIGAFSVIVLSDTKHFDHVLEKVEWSSLLFFATLFIMMGALSRLGLIDFVGDSVTSAILQVPENARLPVAITIIVWLSAIVSAIIDSIPYTTAMIPVILAMADNLRLPLKPLVFSLAYGTGLGGNGSIIGSTANLVVAGLSSKAGYPISFLYFSKNGIPIMLLSTAISNVYLLFVHCVFGLGMSMPQ